MDAQFCALGSLHRRAALRAAAGLLAAGPLAGLAKAEEKSKVVIRADENLPDFDRLQTILADHRQRILDTLKLPETNEKIEVYIFRSKQSYASYLSRRYPSAPQRRALFVKDQGPGMVFVHRSPDFDVDLLHEATHAVLHAVLPDVPIWLDEGLAEYYEAPPRERFDSNPHLAQVRYNCLTGYMPPLAKLEGARYAEDLDASAYRNAWSWIHFMLHGPESAYDTLLDYLADLRQGANPGSLERRLAESTPNLRAHFLAHYRALPSPGEALANTSVGQ